MSGLLQTVAPSSEPITLAEAKAWLRVSGNDEDALIAALIDAARSYVETFTGRALMTQQWELALDSFPVGCGYSGYVPALRSRHIVLPRAPLVTVESVKYYDADGALQTFAPAGYYVDDRSQPGRIVLNADYDWPETQLRPNAVIVAYTVGYGAATAVPQGLRTALRFMVAHWFENRVHINIGNIVNSIPDSAEALLWQFRLPVAY